MPKKAMDLTGERFGKLSVLKRCPQNSPSGATWICQCDCGKIKVVPGSNLRSGNTKSCGCAKGKLAMETKMENGYMPPNLIGRKFGRLTVIEKSKQRNGKNPIWLCVCDCGKEREIIQENLLNGHTKSCGCLSSRRTIGTRTLTHGASETRLYYVWRSMKARCQNPKVESYPYYGGRGIKVCDEWKENFQAFQKWAFSTGYQSDAPFGECTIDRKNVDGDYEPSNCRWVSLEVQAQNKRANHERKI